MKPSEFWGMTYAEWGLVADGYIKRLNREHDERMHHAWHTASLTRIPLRSEFPRLSDLLISDKPKPEEQTVDAMMAAAKMWTVALGGEVKESG